MPANTLSVREELTDGDKAVIFYVDGQLDTYSFELLTSAIQAHLDENRFRLLFDLTGVNYISSTCVGVFLAAFSTCEQNGGVIIILNPAPKVQVVFESFGLTEMFVLTNDRNAALARLKQGLSV